ncbi:MAG: glycine cleavage system protein GcvH [Chloroflexota bacterium]|nr:MAG: glycine cleavage system protein GcvH [Chloroflexota bacterium]
MAGNFPDDLRYTKDDEWVRRETDEAVYGVTSFATEQLGDIVFLQLPDVGARFAQGEAFGEIESVKAVSELYCPVGGEIVRVNDDLDQNPGLVNEDPYGRGWLARVRLDDPEELENLLDAAAYEQKTLEPH